MEPYSRIRYAKDDRFGKYVTDLLRKTGVVVIESVIGSTACDALMEELVSGFERLCPDLDRSKPDTWIDSNLPPQTRKGLFQSVVSNLPPVWKLRTNERIGRVFGSIYTELRGTPTTDLVVSGDGVNVKHNLTGPYGPVGKDWAHLDQTRGDPFRCVQGQVVLTNTTACLVASPGSHKCFADVIAVGSDEKRDGWYKFETHEVPLARTVVVESNGSWQIPILAPKGSLVLWLSSVVHSARHQLAPEPRREDDPWAGWRGVVYVSMRPRRELSVRDLARRIRAYEENRVTNHWSSKLFPKNPNYFYQRGFPVGLTLPDGRNYAEDPATVYETIPRPELKTTRELRLVGYDV